MPARRQEAMRVAYRIRPQSIAERAYVTNQVIEPCAPRESEAPSLAPMLMLSVA
jgi:hypothetical protein